MSPKLQVNSETNKQPKAIEFPLDFKCKHCGKVCSQFVSKEELKTGFVEDTRILVEYFEDTEKHLGSWIEIVSDIKKGLLISFCPCVLPLHDKQEFEYMFIDDEYKDGMPLQAIAHTKLNKSKTTYRVVNYRTPK